MGPDELAFTAPEGGPLHYNNFLARCWHPALDELGLPKVGVHVLRHSTAARIVQAGSSREDAAGGGHTANRSASQGIDRGCCSLWGHLVAAGIVLAGSALTCRRIVIVESVNPRSQATGRNR